MSSLRVLDMELARGVIAAASEAIVVVDEKGTVVFVTPQAEALWGYRAEELTGRAFEGLRERDDGDGTRRTPRADTGYVGYVGVRRDGTEFVAEVRLSPIPTADATFVAVVVRDASLPREGTRTTPSTPPPAIAPASPEGGEETPAGPARGRVLIVDDDAAVAKTLGRILSDEHTCTVALGGREAIARIRSGERYDAILCDLSMPDAGGDDVHRELVAIAPDQATRMVFVSGGAFTAAAHAFLSSIDNPQVDKPFDAQSIRALVRSLVARPSVAPRN